MTPLFKLPETAQEVFDIVVNHMLRQNARSVDTSCKYRWKDLKCAADVLIPDEVYSMLIFLKIISFFLAMFFTSSIVKNFQIFLSPNKDIKIRSLPSVPTEKLAGLFWSIFYALNLF